MILHLVLTTQDSESLSFISIPLSGWSFLSLRTIMSGQTPFIIFFVQNAHA